MRPQLYNYCIDCGKPLKDPESKKRGRGAICYERHQILKAKGVILNLPLDVKVKIAERQKGLNGETSD